MRAERRWYRVVVRSIGGLNADDQLMTVGEISMPLFVYRRVAIYG